MKAQSPVELLAQKETKNPQTNFSLATKLGWVSFFNDCSSEAIARTLPLLLTASLGASPTFLGTVEGLAETVSILLKGFSGWLSDRMQSRKPLVVLGYGFSLISRFLLAGTYITPTLVGFARVFDRTGKGLRSAPRDAMVADAVVAGNAGRDFGITRFLDTLGAVTGLSLIYFLEIGNGALDRVVFQKIVWMALPFGLISLLLILFWVPRIPREIKSKKYLSVHIPQKVRVYLAIVFVFALGNSSDAFLVLKAREIGMKFSEILALLIGFNLVAALLAIPVGKLSDKFGRFRFLAMGWLVYALAYFCIARTESAILFSFSMLFYGAFYGFTEGIEKAILSDLLPAQERGAGYGALQLILGLAALPASLLTGFLMTHYGSRFAFTVCGGLALFGTLALLFWQFSKQKFNNLRFK